MTSKTRRHSLALCIGCCLLLVSVGCSSSEPEQPTGTVKGTLTLNGEPFSNAGVVFYSAETGSGMGFAVASDGTFGHDKPLWTGNYKVTLGAKQPSPEDLEAGKIPSPSVDPGIPKRLLDPSTTYFSAEVKAGVNEYTFEINPTS